MGDAIIKMLILLVHITEGANVGIVMSRAMVICDKYFRNVVN